MIILIKILLLKLIFLYSFSFYYSFIFVQIFFNCIKASARKQPKKPCKKKRYSQIKKRIAKLLSDTRLCIGAWTSTLSYHFLSWIHLLNTLKHSCHNYIQYSLLNCIYFSKIISTNLTSRNSIINLKSTVTIQRIKSVNQLSII